MGIVDIPRARKNCSENDLTAEVEQILEAGLTMHPASKEYKICYLKKGC
jgi:hypothetical protein